MDIVLAYHVSPAMNRASIEEHGLDDTLATSSPWSNCDAWDEGVYLWDDLDAARTYADGMLESPSDIYMVDVAGIALIPDPSLLPEQLKDDWLRHAIYTFAPIPSSCVRHLETARQPHSSRRAAMKVLRDAARKP